MIDIINNRIAALRAEVDLLAQRGAAMEASLISLKEEVMAKNACIAELESIVANFTAPQLSSEEGWSKQPTPGPGDA